MSETLEEMMEEFCKRWKPFIDEHWWQELEKSRMLKDLRALCDVAVREHEIVGCIIHDPKTYFRCPKCGAGQFVVRGSTILYQGDD